jgi:hypothetical protein
MSTSRHWIALAVILIASAISLHSQSEPPLALSERPGGNGVQAAVADGSGGIWIVGWTATALAVTPDAFQRHPAGSSDIFLSHIGASGELLYSTYFGGTGIDEANGITRDAAGNLYIVGGTNSTDFLNTTGAVRSGSLGTWEAFLTKFDPTGRRVLYSTYFGGTESDIAHGIAVDAGGTAHVVGSTRGYGFPNTTGYTCLPSWLNAFHTRVSPDGRAVLSSTCFHDSVAYRVAVDANANAYVVGRAGPSFGPRMNSLKPSFPTGPVANQGFLAKVSGSTVAFSTYLGGSLDDWASDVAVTAKGIYVAGGGYSTDYAGAPTRTTNGGGRDGAGWITKVRLDGAAILGTALIDGNGPGEEVGSLQVDASEVVHAAGSTDSTNFVGSTGDDLPWWDRPNAFYATVWAPNNIIEQPSFVRALGGTREDRGSALAFDGTGGAWIAGRTFSSDFPLVNAKTNSPSGSFVARFGQPRTPPAAGAGDIVLYARDASAAAGEWRLVSDASAAGGIRAWNPDAGILKITAPAAAPANYFEVTFEASAGVSYHLWLRMKADNDHWTNDSVWVQFSDSVDASGSPIWQIGTNSGTSVSLEDCSNCGEQGWGWNDNGYDSVGMAVRFASSGSHTIRIQQREDGISVDQIVLSSERWATVAPGASKNDATILAPTAAPPPPPPPPPPSDPREIVMYVAGERLAGGQNWILTSDETAAGSARLFNPDAGQPKLSSPSASGSDYFEVQFTAEAGVPYHLWVRSQAVNDHWQNDSVFVQFSDSVDAGGNPVWRIGSDSASVISLEECSGCGEQGWGWNDNKYDGFAAPIYFAKSGPQTIRVLRREDGISVDQIVLSAGRYLNASPGLAKNDTTIVPK